MTCQRCAARPATVHVTEVGAEGNHAEAHLCGLCCQEAGWNPVAVPPPVAELVAAKPSESNEKDDENGAPCPSCGLRFAEYQQVNLFGCAHDWTTFEDEVGELVQRWHGAEAHVGRRPGDGQPAEGDACRAELETELAAAVANEHYEEAASIRDRLRRLGTSA